MEEFNQLRNIKIDEEKNFALFEINPEIYDLDVIKSAAYLLMDKGYVFLDKGDNGNIKVELKAKDNNKISDIIHHFNKELLNYSVYKVQSEKNKNLREILLQRVLLTNDPEYLRIISREEKGTNEQENQH